MLYYNTHKHVSKFDKTVKYNFIMLSYEDL